MIAIRLLSNRPERREWLTSVLNALPDLSVICSGDNVDAIAQQPHLGADTIAVDLAFPQVSTSHFWSVLHVRFPGARLVALVDTPIDPLNFQAALHAGAYYMVDWQEPVERIWRAALAAGRCDGFIPLGHVLEAMVDYFHFTELSIPTLRIGHVQLDSGRHILVSDDGEISLTKTEFNLLWHLAINAGRIVTPSELAEAIWHQSPQPGTPRDRVKSTVKRLRRKIEEEPEHPKYILTRRGYGYYMPKDIVN